MEHAEALERLCQLLNPQNKIEGVINTLTAADWLELYQESIGQGVALLLYDRVKSLGEPVPEEMQGKLRQANLEATARNLVMLHHAGNILKALRQQDIAVIPLKGLYLAENVYTGIGLRAFEDLDLLVHKGDIGRALMAMQDMGYSLSTWYDAGAANTNIKHLPPLMKPGGPIVELHWRLLEEDAPFKIDMEGIWQRAVTERVAEVDVKCQSLEDLLLHLSVHFTYQHRLAGGLVRLYDIAELIWKKGEVIDWEAARGIAAEWGAERALWLSLRLAQEITGAGVPQQVTDQLVAGEGGSGIVEEAKRQLLSKNAGEPFLTPDLAALTQVKGLGGKLKLGMSRVFLPRSVLAREYYVNPRSLLIYWYYARRFVRLFRQYRRQAWGVMAQSEGTKGAVESELAKARLNRWLDGREI